MASNDIMKEHAIIYFNFEVYDCACQVFKGFIQSSLRNESLHLWLFLLKTSTIKDNNPNSDDITSICKHKTFQEMWKVIT